MEKKFKEFIKELEKISNQYKIGIDVTGGVNFSKEQKYFYNCDSTSGDLICVNDYNEVYGYSKEDELSERFQDFGEELTSLSNRLHIGIQSIGGVSIYNKDLDKNILNYLKYDCDYTSGDINYNLIEKEIKLEKEDLNNKKIPKYLKKTDINMLLRTNFFNETGNYDSDLKISKFFNEKINKIFKNDKKLNYNKILELIPNEKLAKKTSIEM